MVLALVAALVRSPAPATAIASWYPGSAGFLGTVHAAMPGAWYGRFNWIARVCTATECLPIPVVDRCGCPGGRLIDLSLPAVRALGLDPARGLYTVSVEVIRP